MTIPGHRTCHQMQQMTPADNYSVIVQLQRRWLINDLEPSFGQSQAEREEERAQWRELGEFGEEDSHHCAREVGQTFRQGRDSRTLLGDCSGT